MKFFLCDDDREMHELYKSKLSKLCKKHDISFEFINYFSGENMLFDFEKHNGFDGVLLLDINMPTTNGISVAKELRQRGSKCEIIFLTISKQHFISAFDVGAFNYIIKGETSYTRFESVFLKATTSAFERGQKYMLVTRGGEYRNIAIKSIRYFEIMKRVITVHYNDNESFDFFSSLDKIENELFGQGFVRVYRSFLVFIPCIESFTRTEIIMQDKTVIPVGRKYCQDVKDALSDYFNRLEI